MDGARRPALVAVLAIGLTACGTSGASRTALPTPEPSPSLAMPTATLEAGMPAEFEEQLCLALNQLGEASQDIAEMGDAAAAGDTERVGLMAYAASGYATTVQFILDQIPHWEPGASAVAALSDLTDDLVTGLELIDEATLEGDSAKMAEGNQLVQDAAAALVAATPELGRLRDEYGLGCPLPGDGS